VFREITQMLGRAPKRDLQGSIDDVLQAREDGMSVTAYSSIMTLT